MKENFKTILRSLKDALYLIRWKLNKGKKSLPAPHSLKKHTIVQYAKKYNLDIFVETGTYKGDMIRKVHNLFKEIHSIELNEYLHNKARQKFKAHKNINLHLGDSGEVIQTVLKKIDKPSLFWLDGHYSGGITSKGDLETPISKELQHIFEHNLQNHVILIDDARCFGTGDYPTIENLIQEIKKWDSSKNIEVKNDIIRII
ncbi:MAG: hypothetical protein ACNS60_04565 [Candidatus Cyclobacteriaceae bacterium M2_1C_046]